MWLVLVLCLVLSRASALKLPAVSFNRASASAVSDSATSALSTALPACAVDDVDAIPDAVNVALTVAIAAPVLFIAKFALDAAVEIDSQTEERLDRAGLSGKNKAPRGRQSTTIRTSATRRTARPLRTRVRGRSRANSRVRTASATLPGWLLTSRRSRRSRRSATPPRRRNKVQAKSKGLFGR
jgi:hypothetical protein